MGAKTQGLVTPPQGHAGSAAIDRRQAEAILYIRDSKRRPMTTQMILRIDPDLKSKVDRLAKAEGKTTSSLVREVLAEYVTDHDPAAHIDDLWDRIGSALKRKRVGPADIARAIREVRTEKP